jgi:hypothetical protein
MVIVVVLDIAAERRWGIYLYFKQKRGDEEEKQALKLAGPLG